MEEEKEPDISIDEFRAIRKQFHERQSKVTLQYSHFMLYAILQLLFLTYISDQLQLFLIDACFVSADAKIKKYHRNLDRESDDEDENDDDNENDDKSEESQYVCDNCKEIRKEKAV